MIIREAAVAGTFYDADPLRLQHQVETLLAQTAEVEPALPRALIVPHAGLVYSGATAARAYARLRDLAASIRRVVLLGPAHREYVDGLAVPAAARFRTPLGEIPLDRRGLAEIAQMPGVIVSDAAHRDEHCLEVQLPFLQTLLDDVSLLPILVGNAGVETVAAVIERFASDSGTLIVISSDLSHFLDYDTARAADGDTVRRILQRDTSLRGEQACGARAINGLMASAVGRSAQVELLHACNSGDTAGNRNRVVGYAAFILR